VEPAHWPPVELDWWVETVRRFEILRIILTHHHMDHTIGMQELQDATGIEVWSPPRGAPTEFTPHQKYRIDRELHEGDVIGKWQVIDLPGHDYTQIGLWDGRSALVADAIAVGTGLPVDLRASFRRLVKLDPEIVLPAHGAVFLDHTFEFCARLMLSGLL